MYAAAVAGVLRAVALAAVGVALLVVPAAFADSSPQLVVSVTLPDGSPAAHATIFLNDTQVEAGSDGRWQGPVPTPRDGRVYEAAALDGYASHGVRWFDLDRIPPDLPVSLPLDDHLVSLFDAPTTVYPDG